jgi:hypothetical protein
MSQELMMNPLRFLVALGAAIAAWMALMWFALMAVSATPEARRDRVGEPTAAPAAAVEPAAPSTPTDGHVGLRFDASAEQSAAAAAVPGSELAGLERRYLACNRAAMEQALGFGEAAQCSVTYERLLSERFGGDFERLLQWSRAAHRADDDARTASVDGDHR